MPWKATVGKIANTLLRPWDIRVVRGIDVWRPLSQLGRQPSPPPLRPNSIFSEPFLKSYVGQSVGALQTPFDFAVVMPSILRPTIADAIASVFAQDFPGRVQLLIGVDEPIGEMRHVEVL